MSRVSWGRVGEKVQCIMNVYYTSVLGMSTLFLEVFGVVFGLAVVQVAAQPSRT